MARQRDQPAQSNRSKGSTAHSGHVKKRTEPETTTDSQDILAVPQILSKLKSDEREIKEFGTRVAADQRALKTLLQQRLSDAEEKEGQRHGELVCTITAALQSPTRQNAILTLPDTKIAGSPAAEYVGRLDGKCRSLLDDYEAFEAMVSRLASEQKEAMRDTWTEDVQRTEALLKLGHKAASRRVRKSLGVQDEGKEEEEEVHDADDEMVNGLKDTLNYAERGVKRMVKALPKDEMEWE